MESNNSAFYINFVDEDQNTVRETNFKIFTIVNIHHSIDICSRKCSNSLRKTPSTDQGVVKMGHGEQPPVPPSLPTAMGGRP